MSNILITGGAGFIGSNLARRIKQPSNNVVIVDNLSTGKLNNIPFDSGVKFIKCDVNDVHDISQIMLSTKFDYVFHYAAVVGVERTQRNPISVLNDIKGFENILTLCKNTGVKKVFFASSSEVYGESISYPQNEHTTPLNSRLPYAIVKNVGEAFMKSYCMEHGIEYTIFRFFNTYGSNQSEDFVMNRFLRAALKNQDIKIYGDGSQTRTFCHVMDNVDACSIIFLNNLVKNDVINIGGDREYSMLELANLIIHVTGSKSKIVFVPALKEGDMNRRCPDNDKMKKILGYKLIELPEGIRRILNDWKVRDAEGEKATWA